MRKLTNSEMNAVAGGMGIVTGGSPFIGVVLDGSPFMGIVWSGNFFIPIPNGGLPPIQPVMPPELGKP